MVADAPLALAVTPTGSLHLVPAGGDAVGTLGAEARARIASAFARGADHGLLHLGAVEVATALPPSLAFFRELGRRFFAHLCAVGDIEEVRERFSLPAPREELDAMAAAAPPLPGAEYLDGAVLAALWAALEALARREIARHSGTVQSWLREKSPVWQVVGRVHFHLAETKNDEEHPFAFLATFTTRVGDGARVRHLPLGQALGRFAGDRAALLGLLAPVDQAARSSAFLKRLVESQEVYHPQPFTPDDAYRFLKDIPIFEAAGVVVRVPDWWKPERPRAVQVSVTVGERAPSSLGLSALMDFRVALTLDGEPLDEAALADLLRGGAGLRLVRGRWVELDGDKLGEVLSHWKRVQNAAARDGLSFRDGMRLLAGAPVEGAAAEAAESAAGPARAWVHVGAGDWLRGTLSSLRQPESLADAALARLEGSLHASLRPYQAIGVGWLRFLGQLGLGACLADDMGLGKTIQVLALLLLARPAGRPSLLIVPASLIGNWQSEIDRFAPALRTLIAHPSSIPARELAQLPRERLAGLDLVITTYGSAHRLSWLSGIDWSYLILDEAQAIKNPAARQSRAVKELRAERRVALTGTPIENRLGDLWSLFDFLNPGLLGSAKEFTTYSKKLSAGAEGANWAPLRALVRPYILRRLKTDKRVIADLPDKTEVRANCALSKKQAALYQKSVDELRGVLSELSGIERRGAVLSFLLRFKQICNHPSQWLGDAAYLAEDSGKFQRLAEICEEIAARQEKVLVFTQFREMTRPLAEHLRGVFGAPGLVLDGQTPIKERKALVDRFQNDADPGYFVLSLKAGGTGLNLTAASHVIHFDRWWNPAVENQATDRAFRIGQKKNVLVHKFVCRGTIEEKIEALLESKRGLSGEILEGDGEPPLTELNDEQLIDFVSLDIHRALAGD